MARGSRGSLLVGLFALLTSASARAQPRHDAEGPLLPTVSDAGSSLGPDLEGRRYSLPRILELADRNHPTIAQARAQLMQVRAQLDEAHWAPFFSQWKMTAGVSLAPTVRGTNVFSPNTDVSLTSSLGLGWRADITGLVPLWTFGKITNLWDAAGANVKVNEANVEVQRDSVRLDVRRAFFGLQLARDGLALLEDVRSAFDKGIARIEDEIARGEGDEIELLRMKTYLAELEVRGSEAQRYVAVTLGGLRFYTGVPDLDIADEPLHVPRHRLGHVTRYLAAAKLYRPEIAMANAGIAARSAQLHLARSNLFPDIGLALSAGLSVAPEVADQINPFVSDPGNYFHYGAALGLQWKLDFVPGTARIRYAEWQLEEVRAQQRFALGGVGAEVEQAYAEVVDWATRVDAWRKSTSNARKWLVMVQQNIDVGIMDDEMLVEPARRYAEHRYNLQNAIMELDMAMSRLAKATGWDAIAPDGR